MSDKTSEERIALLEQQVEDLAAFVGRLTNGVVGDNFDRYDCQDDELLVWEQFAPLPGDEDGGPVGWWTYKAAPPGVKASVDAS